LLKGKEEDLKKTVAIGAVVVGTILGHQLESMATCDRTISFPTTVSAVPLSDDAHYETRYVLGFRSGHYRTTGPYYRQIVSIPECPIYLAGNHLGAPLTPGQHIETTFFLKGDTIVSWSASPGPRPAAQ
jgi:hypothetical protein